MLPLLVAARRLTAAGVAVTLVNDHPRLFYSGMVPEHIGGVYTRDEATVDLAAWCGRTGVRFVPRRAVALHPVDRTVTTDDGAVHPFDLAAIDVGTRPPGIERAEAAIPTKPLHRIERLVRFVEEALAAPEGIRRLAVVGGGAAGVEVSLNLSARPAPRPDALSITLLEPSDHLLDAFPRRLQRRALRTLRSRGVTVRLGCRAGGADAGSVYLENGEAVAADAVLWATGTEGLPFLQEAGLPVDDRGLVRVAPTLQVTGVPHLFVAGDAAVVEGHGGLARVGVHAVKQGPVLRDNVFLAVSALGAGRALEQTDFRPFRPYPVAPLILSTGAPTGWMNVGPLGLTGEPILRLKHLVDRRWMRRYRLGAPYPSLVDARSASDAPARAAWRRS